MKLRTLSFGVIALLACVSSAQQGTQSFQGKKLPAFKATTVTGKKFDNSNLKGKVVIMDFWATWCGPCRLAAPSLQALHTKYGKKGLLVIGANLMEQTPKTSVPAYIKEHKYTYQFTIGNDALAKTLQVTGIPTMLVIDKKGVIKLVVPGLIRNLESELEKAIKPLL